MSFTTTSQLHPVGASSLGTNTTVPMSVASTTTTSTGPMLVDSNITTRTTDAGATVLPTTTSSTSYASSNTSNALNTSTSYSTGAAFQQQQQQQTSAISAAALHPADDATVVRTGEQVVEQVQTVQLATVNKYVTTEHQVTAVPVQRERAVVERVPLSQREPGTIESFAHVEVPLMAERAVATKESVPVERVRMGLGVESIEKVDTADVAKEQTEYVSTSEGQTKTLGSAPIVNVSTAGTGNTVVATERV